LTCSACGGQFDLTPEYLAEYGGRTTTCTCGAALAIPPSGTAAIPQLSYVAPSRASAKVPANAWRDGSLVVMTRGALLPNRCARCGVPVDRKFRFTTLYPEHVSFSGTSFLIRRFLGDRVRVRYGFCREHTPLLESEAARVTLVASWVAIPVFMASANLVEKRSVVLFWALISLTVAALALGMILLFVGKSIKIHDLDYRHVWLAGFREPYLDTFPSLEHQQNQDAREAADRLNSLDA